MIQLPKGELGFLFMKWRWQDNNSRSHLWGDSLEHLTEFSRARLLPSTEEVFCLYFGMLRIGKLRAVPLALDFLFFSLFPSFTKLNFWSSCHQHVKDIVFWGVCSAWLEKRQIEFTSNACRTPSFQWLFAQSSSCLKPQRSVTEETSISPGGIQVPLFCRQEQRILPEGVCIMWGIRDFLWKFQMDVQTCPGSQAHRPSSVHISFLC